MGKWEYTSYLTLLLSSSFPASASHLPNQTHSSSRVREPGCHHPHKSISQVQQQGRKGKIKLERQSEDNQLHILFKLTDALNAPTIFPFTINCETPFKKMYHQEKKILSIKLQPTNDW
jgi:hypothetical protein